MIAFSWDQRIRRARQLADEQSAAAELLRFYAFVAEFQKGIYERLIAGPTSPAPESLESDVKPFLSLIRSIGPSAIAQQAREIENTSIDAVLADAESFFARALLQPYMESVATRDGGCPFCGQQPQAAVLRAEGEGARRSLVCSLCSNEWTFRRVVCPQCGEEKNDRLPVYTAAEIQHVRVDACDNCHMYIKSIDLSKNGLAVPVVDEIASVALDLWANENGYTKLKTNLLGV